jgi:hypothetical protein
MGRPGPDCRKEADAEGFRHDDAIRNDLCLLFLEYCDAQFLYLLSSCQHTLSQNHFIIPLEICRDLLNLVQ